MAKGKIDQRVMLTNRLLKDALARLMSEQHISKISVRELCETAGINRSTFYAHYRDQYHLLSYVEQEALNNIKRHLGSQDFSDSLPISAQALNRILDYFKDNVELFKALLSENSDFAFQRSVIQLGQIVSYQINNVSNARTQEYLQEFGIMGCISVVQKWIQSGMIESTAQMTELIMQILYSGIASFSNTRKGKARGLAGG